MEVVLDLGTGGDFETGLAEQLFDTQPHFRDRVQSAATLTATRQGDVNGFLRELLRDRGLFEFGALGLDGRGNLFLDAIDAGADFLALLGGELAQLLELVSEPA